MNIIKGLAELAETAPEMCQHEGVLFIVGEYQFFEHHDHPLIARIGNVGASCKGQPALAWLADALLAECGRQDLRVSVPALFPGKVIVDIERVRERASTLAEALLAALVAAVG